MCVFFFQSQVISFSGCFVFFVFCLGEGEGVTVGELKKQHGGVSYEI